jgi:hypothetical protein
MLLHPRRRSWKLLMRRAFERYLPALGPAVLVSSLAAANAPGRSPRHVGYWRAFSQLKPHRLLEPARVSPHQHLQERLASNCRITRRGTGASLAPSAQWLRVLHPAVQCAGGLTVGGLRAGLSNPDVAVSSAAVKVRGCVHQAEWLAALAAPLPPPADWVQSPCGGAVYWHAAPGGGQGYAVRPDGRLATQDAEWDGWAGWRPACVVWCPLAKGQRLLVKVPPPEHLLSGSPSKFDTDSSKLQPYLLGAWQEVWVDPNAWALGPVPVSHFVVKAAARRLLLMRLRVADSEFSVADGRRPRLWPGPDGTGGLLGLEQRWQALYTSKCVLLRARDRTGRRRLGDAVCSPPVSAVVGRVHPLERAAAAAVQRGQLAIDGFDDAADALLVGVLDGMPAERPAWRKAYELLRLPRLDRVTRHFGWRLVHGALRCNAATVPWCKVPSLQELHAEVCCSAAACSDIPQLESLSHVFMHCPVVQPAVVWLQDLWARLVPGSRLPLDVRVLVAGDHTVWDPGGAAAGVELWAHLRLLFCRAVWHLRCCRVASGQVFTAAAVVALTAAWVARAVRLDWLRVSTDLAGTATALPSWCLIHKRFDLSQADFSQRWCLGNVLAHVSTDAAGLPALCVHVPAVVPAVTGPTVAP